MAAGGERVRFLVELMRNGSEVVSGWVRAEGADAAIPFCGWLELLALLEAAPSGADGATPAAPEGAG